MADAPHGWLVIDKPVGTGSTQVVSAVKRALRAGGYPKVKVGHGGTLDPLASGVLPIALGEATKLAGRLLDSDKVYEFTVRFGEETDTLDAEGRVVATSDARPTGAEVDAVLARFTGPQEQVPPVYSALKVGGERAYHLARAGEVVELASRRVVVRSLRSSPARGGGQSRSDGGGGAAPDGVPGPSSLHHSPSARVSGRSSPREDLEPPGAVRPDTPPPRAGEEQITLTAHVSKGTYIRSLARDVAHALGTVGHVTYLRRLKAGPFTLAQAIALDKLAELGQGRALEHHLLPLRAGLDDIPALSLTPDQAGALRQGRVLDGIAADDGLHLALLDDVPVALVEVRDREVRVERGFNL